MALANDQYLANPGIAACLERKAAQGASVGAEVLNSLEDLANVNVDEVVWHAGDTFTVPSEDVLRKTLTSVAFRAGDREIPTPSVVVSLDKADGTQGGVKYLYLSTLKKSAVPYAKKVTAAGVEIVGNPDATVHSNTRFYNEVMAQPTFRKIYDILASKAGKQITVTDVKTVETARYRANEIIGTRKTTVPFFKVVGEDLTCYCLRRNNR